MAAGGHSTPGLKKAVCNFLTQEWDRKVLPLSLSQLLFADLMAGTHL